MIFKLYLPVRVLCSPRHSSQLLKLLYIHSYDAFCTHRCQPHRCPREDWRPEIAECAARFLLPKMLAMSPKHVGASLPLVRSQQVPSMHTGFATYGLAKYHESWRGKHCITTRRSSEVSTTRSTRKNKTLRVNMKDTVRLLFCEGFVLPPFIRSDPKFSKHHPDPGGCSHRVALLRRHV